MKKYIILALCLAAVCGCSDDKVTTPDIVDKDTVEKTFKIIEGMLNFNANGIRLETIGDASLIDSICVKNDKYDIRVLPTISYGKKREPNGYTYLNIDIDNKKQNIELVVNIETAKLLPILRESVIEKYGYFSEHKEFKDIEFVRDTFDFFSAAIYTISNEDFEPGVYIVRVKRTGLTDRCTAFILLES